VRAVSTEQHVSLRSWIASLALVVPDVRMFRVHNDPQVSTSVGRLSIRCAAINACAKSDLVTIEMRLTMSRCMLHTVRPTDLTMPDWRDSEAIYCARYLP
jgi:hypothetical protein